MTALGPYRATQPGRDRQGRKQQRRPVQQGEVSKARMDLARALALAGTLTPDQTREAVRRRDSALATALDTSEELTAEDLRLVLESQPELACLVDGEALGSLTPNCARGAGAGRPMVPSSVASRHPIWLAAEERKRSCGRPSTKDWMALQREDGRTAELPAQCHCRHHDGCREADTAERVSQLAPWSLMTFTWRATSSRWRRDKVWLEAWTSWRRWLNLMRSAWWFRRPRYVAVLEAHKSGWPHLHVASDLVVPETVTELNDEGIETVVASEAIRKEMAAAWLRCGGGWNVRWELIREDARYIAKYVGKASGVSKDVMALLTVNAVRMRNRSPMDPLTEVDRASLDAWRRGVARLFEGDAVRQGPWPKPPSKRLKWSADRVKTREEALLKNVQVHQPLELPPG